VGFNFNDTLAIIGHYATRNVLMHSNLFHIVKAWKPATLAKRLHDDFCDLPNIVPASQVAELNLMQQLIASIIGLWFRRDSEDDFEMWSSTEALEELMVVSARADPAEEAAAWKRATEEIAKLLRKRLYEQQRRKGVVDEFDRHFKLVTGNLQPKRVASAKLEGERQLAKKKGRQWGKVLGLMQNTRKMSDNYTMKWGEITPPPQIVHDPRLC
jgi:hypothetical protein